MDPDKSVERIRRRMAELRCELSCDVQEVGRSARAMTDIGLYVRRFPWASVAVAVAAGYLLVPRKKEIIYHPDSDTLARLIRHDQVRVDTTTPQQSAKGMVKSLLVMGLMGAARIGMNHIVSRLTSAPGSGGERPTTATAHETWNI